VTNSGIFLSKEGWPKCRPSFLLLIPVYIFLGCQGMENRKIIEYQGPVREAENMEMLYAENDLLRVKNERLKHPGIQKRRQGISGRPVHRIF